MQKVIFIFLRNVLSLHHKNMVMKKTHLLILCLLVFSSLAQAQKWKAYRQTLVGGIGMNNFFGDLGGGGKDAAHFLGVRDLDLVTTRPVLQFGYAYRIWKPLGIKTNLTYARLSAKDASSKSDGRNLRNLNFRTNIWDLTAQLEFYIVESNNNRMNAYQLKLKKNLSVYVFVGAGVFLYNPKTKLEGQWYALRPLATEGQGLEIEYISKDGSANGLKVYTPKPYKKYAFAFPLGLGFKYGINNKLSIGLEISARYTTTDYIDDASDRYFNYNEMKARFPDNSVLQNLSADELKLRNDLAIRALDETTGQVRTNILSGKPMRGSANYNDAYIFTVISVHYAIKKTGRKPKA